jgi:hypothetical protein
MERFKAIGFVPVGSEYKNLPPGACITVSESVIMMADKHTSETYCLFKREEQT